MNIFPKLEHIVYCRMLMPQEILLGHKIQGEWAKSIVVLILECVILFWICAWAMLFTNLHVYV